MNQAFDFTEKIKKALLMMMGCGLLGMLLVFFFYPQNQHSRFWSNILLNTYYFNGIAIFAMFVVAAAQLAYGGWQTLVKRVLLSMSAFTMVGGALLVIILLLGLGGVHNLYGAITHYLHLDPKLVPPSMQTKMSFYAPFFWVTRVVIYSALWAGLSFVLNKFFARTDQTDKLVYKKSRLLAALVIVIFAVTESAVSWDMIMSMDAHWYSTLFGWYNFASYGCAGWATTILLVIFLKSLGYLPQVNENHIHDLGKFLFGFSIFWTYLWFSQFMLQWFGNIPEDTKFWVKRFDVPYFKITIFLSLAINFVFPLLVIIRRTAKRNFKIIGFAAAMLIIGHYIDFFNFTFVEPNWNVAAVEEKEHKEHEALVKQTQHVFYADAETKKEAVSDVAPAKENKETVATKENVEEHKEGKHEEEASLNYAGIGLGEIMIFIGFAGLFLWMFFNNLSKRPIVPENDPYLKECERLVVTYA